MDLNWFYVYVIPENDSRYSLIKGSKETIGDAYKRISIHLKAERYTT